MIYPMSQAVFLHGPIGTEFEPKDSAGEHIHTHIHLYACPHSHPETYTLMFTHTGCVIHFPNITRQLTQISVDTDWVSYDALNSDTVPLGDSRIPWVKGSVL